MEIIIANKDYPLKRVYLIGYIERYIEMTYTTSIANGCTIIKFELEEKPRRALISHCGKDGKYFRIDYSYKSKRYFIGQRKDLEDARELKRLADEHLDDGTFWEWLDQLKKRG